METLITPTEFCIKNPQHQRCSVYGWIKRGRVEGIKQADRKVLCKESELNAYSNKLTELGSHKIFDIFEQKIIEIHRHQITATAILIGSVSGTLFQLLAGKLRHVFYRYVRLEDRYKNFTLIETESGRSYECVRPHSLELQLGIPHEGRWCCAICDLIAGRRHIATIADKSYQLKGETKFQPTRRMKSRNSKLEDFFAEKDIEKRISKALRSRVYSALFKTKTVKKDTTFELIGCSIDYLKSYLSDKFTAGMSWGNYGYRGWHIDHIIPCSAFDLTNHEQQKICFHYTNLQPLWMEDNFSKHDRIQISNTAS